MTQRWLLRLCDPQGRRTQWINLVGKTAEQAAEGDLDAACARLGGQSVVLALPGSAVTLHRVSLPVTSRARLRAAAPYALEEGVANDVEDLHFAVGERDAEGRVAVAVCNREWLHELLAQFAAAGIQVSRVVHESLLLPEPVSGATVLLEADWAVVRGPGIDGYAVEADMLAELSADPGAVEAPGLDVYYTGSVEPTLAGVRALHHCDSALALLRDGVPTVRLDLLQGEFSPGEALGRSLKRWRGTAVLLLLLGVVWVAGALVELSELERRGADLQEQIESVLRQTFPDVRRVVNARTQMTQRLRALRGQQSDDTGFLELLAQVSEALSAEQDLTLVSVNYRRGRLDLEIKAAQIASLYRLQQKLAGSEALEVSVQSANSEQGQAQGRLRIEAKSG